MYQQHGKCQENTDINTNIIHPVCTISTEQAKEILTLQSTYTGVMEQAKKIMTLQFAYAGVME